MYDTKVIKSINIGYWELIHFRKCIHTNGVIYVCYIILPQVCSLDVYCMYVAMRPCAMQIIYYQCTSYMLIIHIQCKLYFARYLYYGNFYKITKWIYLRIFCTKYLCHFFNFIKLEKSTLHRYIASSSIIRIAFCRIDY